MLGQKVSEEELHSMLSEVDINKNGQVELDEYLELMSNLKAGTVSQSRLASLVELEYHKEQGTANKISVDRSGGGF